MVKEIERAGFPTVQMANLIPVAKTVGENKIVPTISIPYPLGDPATTKEEQWKLRYHRVGLVFWGVAEPLAHFIDPQGVKPGTAQAANFAMKVSFKHWGFHPWANYSIIGLALAYFQFRKNKPGLISSIFIPLLGEERVKGPIGKLIDILAIFATVAGVATSLGLGTLQINSGLKYIFNIPETKIVQLLIIGIVTAIFIWTAVSGIDKGIKILSDVNLWSALLLVLLCVFVGPTLKMLNSFTNGMGLYIQNFIKDSLQINAFGNNSWLNIMIENYFIFYDKI